MKIFSIFTFNLFWSFIHFSLSPLIKKIMQIHISHSQKESGGYKKNNIYINILVNIWSIIACIGWSSRTLQNNFKQITLRFLIIFFHSFDAIDCVVVAPGCTPLHPQRIDPPHREKLLAILVPEGRGGSHEARVGSPMLICGCESERALPEVHQHHDVPTGSQGRVEGGAVVLGLAVDLVDYLGVDREENLPLSRVVAAPDHLVRLSPAGGLGLWHELRSWIESNVKLFKIIVELLSCWWFTYIYLIVNKIKPTKSRSYMNGIIIRWVNEGWYL